MTILILSYFSDFPSQYDFDDSYTCDACTDTNLYVEIDASLHPDIILPGDVVEDDADKAVYTVEALDIPDSPTKPSIE